MKCCIYKIKNILTNKIYIGSTVNGLLKRKRTHLSNLMHNKHHSKKLQNSFNKYGKEFFIFEIVEFCSDLNILEREQYWINFYDSFVNGYNCTPIAGNCQGRVVSTKTRLKISNSLSGRKQPRTKEHDIKLSISKMKRVMQYDLTGMFLNEFSSSKEAAKKSNLSPSVISLSCNGKRKCKTFIFKYKDNE